MKEKLPDRVFGMDVEKAYKDFITSADEAQDTTPVNNTRVASPTDLNGADYVVVPGTNILIAKEETFKGKTWDETHFALAENGLYMPTPALFMPYFLAVRDAAMGNVTLYDGNNNHISRDEADDLWKYFSSGHRGGCWTWLDAKFVQGSGAHGLDVLMNHRVTGQPDNRKLDAQLKAPLEACLNEECYINLTFNTQGLATTASGDGEYKQGSNIYFWHPRSDRVAWFDAGSNRASLDCDWDPGLSDSRLGVFACAEGKEE